MDKARTPDKAPIDLLPEVAGPVLFLFGEQHYKCSTRFYNSQKTLFLGFVGSA